MAQFAKGVAVKQVIKPISGAVTSFQVDQETGDVLYQVEWTGEDGSVHTRYFTAAEIEAV